MHLLETTCEHFATSCLDVSVVTNFKRLYESVDDG